MLSEGPDEATLHFFVVNMAQQRAHCPFPHDIVSRLRLGVSLLRPSPNPRSLLDLLGLNDQELQEQMAKSHSYAFNMGHGQITASLFSIVTIPYL